MKKYNRDTDTLPEVLKECIVYWEKGCKGSEYFKGEVFGSDGELAGEDTDETLEGLFLGLLNQVERCSCCLELVTEWDIQPSGCCHKCEEG